MVGHPVYSAGLTIFRKDMELSCRHSREASDGGLSWNAINGITCTEPWM